MFTGAAQAAFAGPIPTSGGLKSAGVGAEELNEGATVSNSVMVFGSAEMVIVIGSSMIIITVILGSIVGFETKEVMYEKERY